MVLIVLDINGVLGDVRKRTAITVRHRSPDVILPTRQPFYLRPNAPHFIAKCNVLGAVALWTSRKEVNAAPIEKYLEVHDCITSDTIRMHGEDCGLVVDFHPIKDACVLRLKYPQYKNEHIIFVDDSPDNIMLDANSEIIPVRTYNAAREKRVDYELLDVYRKIERIIKN